MLNALHQLKSYDKFMYIYLYYLSIRYKLIYNKYILEPLILLNDDHLFMLYTFILMFINNRQYDLRVVLIVCVFFSKISPHILNSLN